MKVAVVCAMNQNRSMEAHALLFKKGFDVSSYGTNQVIKMPGPSINMPNIYPFSITYKEIYEDLIAKNSELYRSNGLLHILERNMAIKEKPENFFEAIRGGQKFDIVITCEEKCFSAIYDGLRNDEFSKIIEKRNSSINFDNGFWLINFNIKDTPSDAIFGANDIYTFLNLIQNNNVEKALENYSDLKKEDLLFSFIVYL